MLKISVYSANHPSHLEPDCDPVELETARAWKRADKAFFIRHGTAVRLVGPPRGLETVEGEMIAKKTRWQPIPSGTPAIGYVNVLQLV